MAQRAWHVYVAGSPADTAAVAIDSRVDEGHYFPASRISGPDQLIFEQKLSPA